MHFLTLCFLSTLLFSWSNPANILAIFPLHAKSHYVMFERLLKHLAEKGHQVDVVTHFVSKDAPPGYNQISLEGTLPSIVNNLPMSVINTWSQYGMIEFMAKFAGANICEIMFNTSVIQSLKRTSKKYDLVITEIFGSDCMLGFGYLFKVPTVSVLSSVALPWANARIGNPDNPAYVPNYFMCAMAKMDLWQRTENTFRLLASKLMYEWWSSQPSDKLSQKFFGNDLPSLAELTSNTSLILTNSHFSISHSRPTVPNFIEVGGLHIQDPKPLSNYFKELVSTDSNGVILLTMGSMVLTETFDEDKLQGLFGAFAELPYKVLWKANRQKFPKNLVIPSNIHFENWLPQIDLLCHPNVKLFVSHGGLLGVQEAIYCGVPRLGIPLFADQIQNIVIAEKMGLAIKVSYEDITKDRILTAARRLLEDDRYKTNCDRVSKEFKDRPLSPLATATYWIEYVIRHNGAPQLRSAGADLAWYQYFLVDVMSIVGLLVALVVYVVVIFLRLMRSFCKRSDKRKVQ